MTSSVLLTQIFEICIIPLLGLLTAYIISFVRAKNKAIKAELDNALYSKYMDMLEDTIVKCVIATNQTYTEALKKMGSFGKEEQKEAFQMTYNAVMAILTEDAKEYLQSATGDFQTFLVKQIEAAVNENKIEMKGE